jgi:predicted transcriptional regulator
LDVRKNYINFEKRKEIYDFILKNPGLHLRELNRRLNYSFGSLRYHLNYLTKRCLIKQVPDNGFSRYYITNKVGKDDKKLLNAFRQEKLRKILLVFLLTEYRKVLYKKDFVNLPNEKLWTNPKPFKILKHRSTLDFHLNKLIDLGIIEIVENHRRVGYRLIDSVIIWDFLIRYWNVLSNKLISSSLKYLNDISISRNMDNYLHELWKIFPHPYYCQ